jgi:glycosyltransferase involved in cell wall biosynthesis
MRVLSVHNFYQRPGGEDQVFANEAALLEKAGHQVSRYEERNERISSGLLAALAATWSARSYSQLGVVARKELPSVAHFHNTFPLISPSAYYSMRRRGVPVVQTLHNFRLLCPGGLLMRDGNPCEECITQGSLRPALEHRCYRDSRASTAAVCGMIATHRAVRTWNRAVDLYIALSEFARGKFIEGGLAAERIVVKRNFVAPDPGVGDGAGGYALFVGRLSKEKGIEMPAAAWRRGVEMPLKVAGDGPLNTIEWPRGVEWLGQQPRERVIELMKNASMLVFPSVWYECAPMTILEALACGLPVIASNIGSIPELVTDHHNGLLFRAGDAEDLAHKVRWAVDNPERMREMRVAARREYETKYTAEINYKRLIEIYEMAIENANVTTRNAKALHTVAPH